MRGLRAVTNTPEEERKLKEAPEADKAEIYMAFIKRAGADPIGRKVKIADLKDNMRVLHNAETVCKNSDFCSQLGGKAEFMTYK